MFGAQICYYLGMTREHAIERRAALERRRDDLVDRLAAVDVSSASMSASGGAKSYTNRSVAELKAKIAFIDKEIARLTFRLGEGPAPGRPRTVEVRFDR